MAPVREGIRHKHQRVYELERRKHLELVYEDSIVAFKSLMRHFKGCQSSFPASFVLIYSPMRSSVELRFVYMLLKWVISNPTLTIKIK